MEPGDLVILKSGGPLMTISYLSSSDSSAGKFWQCVWFDQDEVFHKEIFAEAVLRVEDDSDDDDFESN
jgi:uncharacterized protein YodC (DUF2158 family)